MLNNRLQVLLSDDQRKRLDAIASERRVPVASLVREAIDSQFGEISKGSRLDAVDHISTLKGVFVPPEKLEALIEGEREQSAGSSIKQTPGH